MYYYVQQRFDVILLTKAGAHPQLPTQTKFFDHFQTYTAFYYGHSELSCEEKSKFEFEKKKVQFITESCVFKAKTPANFPFQ